nr:RNA-directed DNA polymerase, eukaryota [Tanacetum cinerariifolium]
MESMGLCSVKTCRGNFAFEYVHSDSVGNSRGILCVWDPNSFRRSNTTISNYFIMIQGVWLKTGVNLLIVAVYTPYDLRDKRMLWDYLAHVINQWDGEVVTMGDFNEVRYKSDRFDDAVFMGQWCDGNINTLVHVLECFYRALGLRIIMSKTWKEVVDMVKSRLSNWKMKALSIGGNRDTTAFWKDNWIGGNVLKDLYPRIYALETFQLVIVSKKLTDSSLDNSFHRKTRGGVEQVQYNPLSDLVHAVTLVPLFDRWGGLWRVRGNSLWLQFGR